MIYGGGLGDVYAPKPDDAKLYLELKGEVARWVQRMAGKSWQRHSGR